LSANQPPADQDHEARLLRAARDDPAQFAAIYERYVDRIYAYCRYRAGAEDAEDLTSQVFIRALEGLAGYRGGSVAAWLFRIAHNCVVDHLRTRRPQVSLEASRLEFAAPDGDPVERMMQADDRQLVRELVATLDDDQRDLLILKLVSGLNATEIGAVIGKRAGAVRVALHRVIARLRTTYQQMQQEREL
jgi:RNA polymerase sigma-70 factor, ECF subfamily